VKETNLAIEASEGPEGIVDGGWSVSAHGGRRLVGVKGLLFYAGSIYCGEVIGVDICCGRGRRR